MFITSRYGFAAAVALLIGMAQPVAAGDLFDGDYGGSIKDAPAPPLFSWTGFYVGGHLGGAWAKPEGDLGCRSLKRLLGQNGDPDELDLDCSDLESSKVVDEDSPSKGRTFKHFYLDNDYIALTERSSSGTESGFMGGIQVGINKQYRNWILGLEADWSGLGDIESTTRSAFEYFDEADDGLEDFDGKGTVFIRNELDWLATFRARLGSVLSGDGRLMGYITGGAAVARVSNSMGAGFVHGEGGDCDIGECFFSRPRGGGNFYQFGGVIGAGAEYALSDRFTIGAEYLYIALSGDRENVVTFYGESGRAFDVEQETGFDDIHSVRVKANFKFN